MKTAWACNVIKKETLAQVFSCEFCEISKNTFFTEKLRVTAFLFQNLHCDVKLKVQVFEILT